MRRHYLFLFFALALFSSVSSFGQQNISAASLSGTVSDANSAAVAGAVVVITETATNRSRTAVTDGAGRYLFNYVPVGDYTIRIEKEGFETLERGFDRNDDTNNNDRPIGVGRNTGRGFDLSSLDLRLSKKFTFGETRSLELLVEGFNVLNRSNFTVPNNVYGTGVAPLPSFGRPTQAFDPRQIQLGFRFAF